MKRLLLIIPLLTLAACESVGDWISFGTDTYIEFKGTVTQKVIEGTVKTSEEYCKLRDQRERLEYRARFAALADSRPETQGMRLEVTCPGDAE